MKHYAVEFTAAASGDIDQILTYIAVHSSPERAYRFCEHIREDCGSLAFAPHRGIIHRNGIRRIGVAGGRASASFRIEEDRVLIVAIRYYGRLR